MHRFSLEQSNVYVMQAPRTDRLTTRMHLNSLNSFSFESKAGLQYTQVTHRLKWRAVRMHAETSEINARGTHLWL